MKTDRGVGVPKKAAPSGMVRHGLVVAGLLGGVFVFGAIFSIWLYVQQVQNGYRLARLYEEQEKLLAMQRKLRLEWYRFEDLSQLEALGQSRFRLAPPRDEQRMLMR